MNSSGLKGLSMDTNRRKSVAEEARLLLERHPVYLDTETTGMHNAAEVIEIGVVDDEANVLYDSLIRARGKIDPAAVRVHGITPEMLAGAPTWDIAWPQAEAVLRDRRVGVYNVEFDLRLMKQTHRFSMLRWALPDSNFSTS
jgi:DNA polymerase III epsilon subunit-like protein